MPDSLLDRIRHAVKESATKVSPENDVRKLHSASVGMVLKPTMSKESIEILLLRRRLFEGDPWSGQIAFPGGKSKPGETPLSTLYREVFEESGIKVEVCEVVGQLSQVFPQNFWIKVTPFVVIVPSEIQVKIDYKEIDEFFWIPLSYFQDENNSSIYSFTRNGRKIETVSFFYKGKYVIWGMTLGIIQNFLATLRQNS